MDDDQVEHDFFNMAMGEYKDSIDDFIEWTRITHHEIQVAMGDSEYEKVTELSGKLFHAVSTVQVGNIHNLISGYANAMNIERSAGIQVYVIAKTALDGLRELHGHLVDIGQPNAELIMVTDLMAGLDKALASSVYGLSEAEGS